MILCDSVILIYFSNSVDSIISNILFSLNSFQLIVFLYENSENPIGKFYPCIPYCQNGKFRGDFLKIAKNKF